jgi:hypothetical protein
MYHAMIRIDSNKMAFPIDCIESIDYYYFEKYESKITKEIKQIEEVKFLLNNKYKFLGLKGITINKRKGEIILETSAKILAYYHNYFEGINKNTISQVFETINKKNIGIIFDIDKCLESGHFLTLDVTTNILIQDCMIKDRIRALESLKYNLKYPPVSYNKKNNNGIVFKGNQKTFKSRLSFYDKYLEMSLKENGKLRDLLGPEGVEQFKNILRVECNLTSFKSIRDKCNSQTNQIMDVLNASGNPCFDLFIKIIKQGTINSYNSPPESSFSELTKRLGVEKIILDFEYDWPRLNKFILSNYGEKSRPTKTLRYVKSLCSELERMTINSEGILRPCDELLTEIHQLIRNAV